MPIVHCGKLFSLGMQWLSLLYSHSGRSAEIIYIRKWQAARGGETQAMRKREKKNSPGYIMELWATDTHCKHQSGMEKHLAYDLNPPPTLTATPLKEGQEIGLCSKAKKLEGRKNGGEGGRAADWRDGCTTIQVYM